MEIKTLEKALTLQKQAYQLLLWAGSEARRSPELMDAEALSSAQTCELWIKRHLNHFPGDLRPGLQDIKAFAFALSSFVSTSFHVEPVSGPRNGFKLVRGAKKFSGRRNKKHADQRAQNDADELKKLALTSLGNEENIVIDKNAIASLFDEAKLAQALSLWTYGCELVRRSEYASQGSAVHHLWLELDEDQRTQLTSEQIWKARSQLVEKLKSKWSE